jgi:hypothetical protein
MPWIEDLKYAEYWRKFISPKTPKGIEIIVETILILL